MPNATLTYDGRQVTFFDCDPNDCIEGYLLQGHWYELPMLEFLRSLKVRGTYIDVGAYVGTFSLFASCFCPSNRVVAFEPNPVSYRKLDKNACGTLDPHPHSIFSPPPSKWDGGGIYTVPYAISDCNGACNMSESGGNRGGSHIISGDGVKVSTLDDLLPAKVLHGGTWNGHSPTVLKIDVENNELAVLRGATITLKTVQHLFIETWPEETCKAYGVPFNGPEIIKLLTDAGFIPVRDFGGDTQYWERSHA